MELKEFIMTALVDIIQAVEQARNKLGDNHGKSICPQMSPAYSHKNKADYDANRGMYYQQVEFDVAVTAETKDGGSGKAGINVMGIKASIGGDTSETNLSVSRIRFQVPISLAAKTE